MKGRLLFQSILNLVGFPRVVIVNDLASTLPIINKPPYSEGQK